jgi:exonuclease III
MAVGTALRADQAPVVIDGSMADWTDIASTSDALGDSVGGALDLLKLQIADDDFFLFLRLSAVEEFDLSENNDLWLYLDTDLDADTGLAVANVGAELAWHFGSRSGAVHFEGTATPITHTDISLRSGPTVSGSSFEIAVSRSAIPDGSTALFSGSATQVLFIDGVGDRLPGAGETLQYAFDLGRLPPESQRTIDRVSPSDLRIVTYNVLHDSPWDASLEESFDRQLAAIDPDIILFQEISSHSTAETLTLIEGWLPGTWTGFGHADVKTISRFAVLDSWTLSGNGAALLDTTAELGLPLLTINVHFPCCANDSNRQNEVDELLGFLRDAQSPGGVIDLAEGTPIIIGGDTNFVGLQQQLHSILTGDIVDQATYGPDFAPDWDGSALTPVISRLTERRMGYTWRNDTSSFWPGHLDYLFYSDSVLTSTHDFIMYTPLMSAPMLDAHNLESEDSLASDHLPVCADFRCIPDGDASHDGLVDVVDIACVLDGFAGVFTTCSAPHVDLRPCAGDGIIDLEDILGVVDAFSSARTCTCPSP